MKFKVFFNTILMTLFCFLGASEAEERINQDALIIANGPFESEVVGSFGNHVKIVALDGAANTLREHNIRPDVILGDMDSITQDTKAYFLSKNVLFENAIDQDATDLSKGIMYCCTKYNPKIIYIACALGGSRTDHTLENFSILKKHYNPTFKLLLVTRTEIIQFLKDETITFKAPIEGKLGLFGFPCATATSSEGSLEWPLTDAYKLELGVASSACNVIKSPEVTLTVKGDALLVRPFKM